MGEHNVDSRTTEEQTQAFTVALLEDVRALELMLERGMIESGVRRVGAEQEMFLVNKGFRPAPLAMEALEVIDDPHFTTELARFNLEANLPVYPFEGDFLNRMETDLRAVLDGAFERIRNLDASIVLTGILPTLRLSDLGLDNMTPNPRYFALNDAMVRLRSGEFETRIRGIDELFCTHDNVMLESCNTSFQLHLQVGPEEFAFLYNIAQLVTAPLLAAAVNSPVLLGKRLWNETRVALFQQSVDARSEVHQKRGGRRRVSFGDAWLNESVMEIFKEDIARFRAVLSTDVEHDAVARVERGEAPDLTALRLHNGTVYRWNRACYGVHDGQAHLRIENRVLPAGPTLIDEMANAAFFYGLMAACAEEYGDVRKRLGFADVKANFVAAARLGLKAQFSWIGDRSVPADELILDELLPMAYAALVDRGIDSSDVDRYLGVLHDRVESGQTGSQWMLDSLANLESSGRTMDERMRILTAATIDRQTTTEPVHTWALAEAGEVNDWRPSYERVGQFMTTDLFTLRPGDIVDLAANVMDWERIRHVPVEDDEGRLVGIITDRILLRLLAKGFAKRDLDPVLIRDVMKPDPVTVDPNTPTLEAMRLMQTRKVGCLPVIDKERLVGLITERDLIDVSAKLLEAQLEEALGQ
jgi:CBS domain-containing protein